MIRVKNHQIPPTIRVDRALGISSEPGGIVAGEKRLEKVRLVKYPMSKWGHLISWIHTRTLTGFLSQP